MSDEKIAKVRIVDNVTGEDVTEQYVAAPPTQLSDDWQVVADALNDDRPLKLMQAHVALAALARLREREAQLEQDVQVGIKTARRWRLAAHNQELTADEISTDAAEWMQRAEAAEARVEKMALAISDALGRYQVTHIHEGLREAMKDMP